MKIMKRKDYIAPCVTVFAYQPEMVVMTSEFDNTKAIQNITPTEEVYDEEFQSRRRNVWDGEDY